MSQFEEYYGRISAEILKAQIPSCPWQNVLYGDWLLCSLGGLPIVFASTLCPLLLLVAFIARGVEWICVI